MKKLLTLPFLLCLLSNMAIASSVRDELAVALIPDSLIRGAASVVRSSDITLSVYNPSHAEYSMHRVVTVLNEAGASQLIIAPSYNRFRKIKDVHLAVYDRSGRLMNKHSTNDMGDYAYAVGYMLYNDIRYKYINLSGGQYPVTIDYTLTISYDSIFDLPDWIIQQPLQSIEQSSFTLDYTQPCRVNFKTYNINIKPRRTDDGTIHQTWSVQHKTALNLPADSYAADYFLPRIDFSPHAFSISSYHGDFDSWNGLCRAWSEMYSHRRLPDSVQTQIKDMVAGVHTEREKVAILYRYLQKNFRYVCINVGLGGMVPFDAATVHAHKYGDCKALSNYMSALLGVVGIRSYPVVINAGETEHAIDTSFPTSHFNHCILYALADSQPTWLECTSHSLSPGQLGTFTENRFGLMIMDHGGQIIRTPDSDPALNHMVLNITIKNTTDSKAKIIASASVAGEYRSQAEPALISGTVRQRDDYLTGTLHIKKLDGLNISTGRDTARKIIADFSGQLADLTDFHAGGKSFLPATFIQSWYPTLAVDTASAFDLVLSTPFSKDEQISYQRISGGAVSLPADIDLDNALIAYYRHSTQTDDRTITIYTHLEIKKQRVPATQISLLRSSLQQVSANLSQKLILTDK